MTKKLSTKETGELLRSFVEWMKFTYEDIMKDVQFRLNEFIGEELTPSELEVFKEEFEYAITNIGFLLAFPKLSETTDGVSQEMLVNAYLIILYTKPICGKEAGINSQHSKDFHAGFNRYYKLADLELMIDEICKHTKNADKSEDYFVVSGKNLRGTGLKTLLKGAIFPIAFKFLKDFLDKELPDHK